MLKAKIGAWAALALALALAALFALAGRSGRTPPPAPPPLPKPVAPAPRRQTAAPATPKIEPRPVRGAGLRDKGEALGGTPPERTGR